MSFNATFDSGDSIDAEFSSHIVVPVTNYYNGEYEVTPTTETQTIPIIGLTARRNITINPIPSNYGLITWNGAVLTVS